MRHRLTLVTRAISCALALVVSVTLRAQTPSHLTPIVALVGSTVYPSPDAAPIRDAAILITGERITAVGPRSRVTVPEGARVIDVSGATVLAGFWNSHVHFTEPKWNGVDTMPVARLDSLLSSMLTRFGFVHVFDTASFPDVTLPLRTRIERGDVPGPEILSALTPFVPVNGSPRYIAPIKLPELPDVATAHKLVTERLAQGADAIKIFTASLTRDRPYPVMRLDVVRAVAADAHAADKLVLAHPTNLAGIEVAVAGGVDVLVHTAPMAGPLSDSLLRAMLRRRMALIPTLALWEDDYGSDTTGMREFVRMGERQLRAYHAIGGRILFGTDEGYTTHYDPTREYELMTEAGLDFRAILASLTTAPAAEFGRATRSGRVAVGQNADLVVVDGDPAADIHALAHVRMTMRQGRVIYGGPAAGGGQRGTGDGRRRAGSR